VKAWKEANSVATLNKKLSAYLGKVGQPPEKMADVIAKQCPQK